MLEKHPAGIEDNEENKYPPQSRSQDTEAELKTGLCGELSPRRRVHCGPRMGTVPRVIDIQALQHLFYVRLSPVKAGRWYN
jgi:hypothetical protein